MKKCFELFLAIHLFSYQVSVIFLSIPGEERSLTNPKSKRSGLNQTRIAIVSLKATHHELRKFREGSKFEVLFRVVSLGLFCRHLI
jgi:hypothetical protein